MKQQWCIPPKANAEFVCRMEHVLDVYMRPYDPKRPVVCMDETNKQMLDDTRAPLPMTPGQPERIDHEYQRQGVANIFLFFEPLAGWRHVCVTARRTRVEWAEAMRQLADVHYPDADCIEVVLDNLNTHDPASFYEAFPPQEAHRLASRFVFHYTPKHGSWLNMAEIELSVLGRQCLDRRIPDQATLTSAVTTWQQQRNRKLTKADWHFTTTDARIKLKHLYSRIHD